MAEITDKTKARTRVKPNPGHDHKSAAIHFGLLHLGNIIWGGQSAANTLAQAVSTGAFGFLAVALMIFSGSIWVPILMHGLADFPMQFETGAQYTKIVTGGADWPYVVVQMVI
jgi:membrane protease YdiL (CAAX protease family)